MTSTPPGRALALTFLLSVGCHTGGDAKPAVSAGAAAPADWLTPPAVPAALAVPPGATLKLHARGVGTQIYVCTAGAAAGAAWVLKAPDAKLYDARGAEIGTHGAGPTWTASDGSAAVAKKVADAPAAAPDAVPWLLLRVSANRGAGTFDDVRYVQRLGTAGGKAPPVGCDAGAVGAAASVPYTADYYFYSGPPAPATP
ncbi:MAG TPA: DUF3455 domain-containing protein [Polyangia bacterium]|nr:DUF3455 domain-containing protein [Polyangia bacterium]